MSPIDNTTIEDKLLRLREITALLTDYQKISQEEFVKDPTLSSAVMYNLIIGIEIIIDIGNHILAEAFQKSAKTYRDVVLFLGENGVIPEPFAKENEFMADFRNRLIHDYDRIDLPYIYNIAHKAPAIFQQFAAYYVTFLEGYNK